MKTSSTAGGPTAKTGWEPGVNVPEQIAIVCGVHGAGKTTVGGRLADTYDQLVFYPQTTDWLLNRGYEPAPVEPFQRAVFDHERVRDRYLAERCQTPVVESWHLGNAAYSQVMPVNDSFRVRQRDHLTKLVDAGVDCVAVVLSFPPAGIWSRSATYAPGSETVQAFERRAETSLESFYEEFDTSLTALSEELDITYSRIDATDDPKTVTEAAADAFGDLQPNW